MSAHAQHDRGREASPHASDDAANGEEEAKSAVGTKMSLMRKGAPAKQGRRRSTGDEETDGEHTRVRSPATHSSTAAAADASAAADSSAVASAAPPPPPTPHRRVKLYALNKGSQWEDKGTGYVTYANERRTHQRTVLDGEGIEITDPAEEQFTLIVTSEAAAGEGSADPRGHSPPPPTLLRHELCCGNDYNTQNSTIITWCNVDSGGDVALSFQDAACCEEAWRLVTEQLLFLHPPPSERQARQQAAREAHALEAEALAMAQASAAAAAAQAAQSSAHNQQYLGGLDGDIVLDHPAMGSIGSMHQQQDSFDLYSMNMDQCEHELHGGGGNGSGGGGASIDHHASHHSSPASHRLADDNPSAPAVSLDGLDALQNRLHSQRISKREMDQLIVIWQNKEAEFEELLCEEREAGRTQPTAAGASAAAGVEGLSRAASPAASAASSVAHPPSSAPCSPSSSLASSASSASFSPILHTLSQLQSIFRTCKALLLTNDVEVLEYLFSDANIAHLLGMLEYDPLWDEHPVWGGRIDSLTGRLVSCPPHDFHTHRNWVARAAFKQPVNFHDEIVLHKVHQSYRLTYLKDVVLFSHLDDPTQATFTQILFVNSMSIVSRLTESTEFVKEMFQQLNAYARVDLSAQEAEREKQHRLERQQTEVLVTGAGEGGRNESTSSMQAVTALDSQEAVTPSSSSSTPPLLTHSLSSASTPPSTTAAMEGVQSASGPASATATASQRTSPSLSIVADASSEHGVVAAMDHSGDASSTPASPSSLPPSSSPSLHALLLFLQELVLLAKGVQIAVRDAFYKMLDANSLFEVLEGILVREEARSNSSGDEDDDDEGLLVAARSPPVSASASRHAPFSSFTSAAAVPGMSASPSSSSSPSSTSPYWLWLVCSDIISNLCIHDASLFRTYLISSFHSPAASSSSSSSQQQHQSILGMLLRLLGARRLSMSVAHQLSCLVRLVLDPEAMSVQDQHLFLGKVYEEQLHKLLRPIKFMQPTSEDEDPFEPLRPAAGAAPLNPLELTQLSRARQQREAQRASYHVAAYHAIELLSYCALHHTFGPPAHIMLSQHQSSDSSSAASSSVQNYFRSFASAHNVLPLVLNVLRSTRRNDLVCSAIRFLRICMGAKDASYAKAIMDHNLLEPVLIHFRNNGARYNLLNSVVCELVHYLNLTHECILPANSAAARGGGLGAQQQAHQQALDNFNPHSLAFLYHLVEGPWWQKYGLDKITYVKTFKESEEIVRDARRKEREERERAQAASAAVGSRPRVAASSAVTMGDEENDVSMYGEGGPAGPRNALSRSVHSIMSDSDSDDDRTQPAGASASASAAANAVAAAAAHAQQQAAHQQARRSRKAHKREKALRHVNQSRLHARRNAASAAEIPSIAAQGAPPAPQQSQSPPQQPAAPRTRNLFSSSVSPPSQPLSFPFAAAASAGDDDDGSPLNYDSSSSSSPESSPEPPGSVGSGGGGEQEDDDEDVAAPTTPTTIRRIIFVTNEGEEVKRVTLATSPPIVAASAPAAASTPSTASPALSEHDVAKQHAHAQMHQQQRRISGLHKRKHDGDDGHLQSSSESPPARSPRLHGASGSSSPPGALSLSSPPPHPSLSPSSASMHSLSPSKHNPFLSLPLSELPPTAQRSPELKPAVLSTMIHAGAVGAGSPALGSTAPISPPRQLTALDLAEDCDAAAAADSSASLTASSSTQPVRVASFGSAGVKLSPHLHPEGFTAMGSSSPPHAPLPPLLLQQMRDDAQAAHAAHATPPPPAQQSTLLASLTASNAASPSQQHESPQPSNKRRKIEQPAH